MLKTSDLLLKKNEVHVWDGELPEMFKDEVFSPQFELETYGLDVAKVASLKTAKVCRGKLLKLRREHKDSMVTPDFLLGDLIEELNKAIKELEREA